MGYLSPLEYYGCWGVVATQRFFFEFSPRTLGEWCNLTNMYFSNGLKPPTSFQIEGLGNDDKNIEYHEGLEYPYGYGVETLNINAVTLNLLRMIRIREEKGLELLTEAEMKGWSRDETLKIKSLWLKPEAIPVPGPRDFGFQKSSILGVWIWNIAIRCPVWRRNESNLKVLKPP